MLPRAKSYLFVLVYTGYIPHLLVEVTEKIVDD